MIQTLTGLLLIAALAAPPADGRLAQAAMKGDLAAVQTLLKEKVDVNATHGDGTTALHWAAQNNNAALADVLLKAGADVHAKTRLNGMTPLFLAARAGHGAMVRTLLKAGSDASMASTQGTTPLMLAAASGSADAVKALLEAKANVNATDKTNGQTALMFAAAANRSEAVKVLAAAGADLNLKSKTNGVPKHGGYDNDDQRRQEVTVMGGNTALHFAAREGHREAAMALVDAGADVNAVSASDNLPVLTQAIIIGHFDLAAYLLEKGANPNLANKTGLTPLFATIDANYASKTWYPPPLENVEQEKTTYMDLAKALIAKGANVNARLAKKPWFRTFGNSMGPDPNGATAFWRATQANDLAAMKMLLEKGADPHIATVKNCTALCVAAGLRHSTQGANLVPDARLEVVKFLVEELKMDVNSKDFVGHTPLHGAAFVGRNDVIQYLFDKGANIKARANTVSGEGDGGGQAYEVEPGTGDTVADLANGWSMNSPQYPETIKLAIKLGSEFSNTCWASTCVNPTRPDKTTTKERERR